MTKSMNDKELKEELLEELRCDLEEDLHGYVICDYLSRDDIDEWKKLHVKISRKLNKTDTCYGKKFL